MIHRLRSRFWIESALAALATVAAILALAWPDWVERVSGLNPDQNNGSYESMLVAVLGVAAMMSAGLATREWRKESTARR